MNMNYQQIIDSLVKVFNEHHSQQQFSSNAAHPPGHYYSPIPSKSEVQHFVANRPNAKLRGINLNEAGQLELLKKISTNRPQDLTFSADSDGKSRYFSNNSQYGSGDATLLALMLHHIRPKRIIEIGSGFTSGLMLDLNDQYFRNDPVELTFIEPNPERLKTLLRHGDRAEVLTYRVQDVPDEVFSRLQRDDVLLVDCSHVARMNSDVNRIYHEILPLLKHGVWVHIHDMFHDFEYLSEWLQSGIFWSEQYVVRSFLQYNSEWNIMMFSDYLHKNFPREVQHYIPEYFSRGGGQLWLKRGL